MPDLQRMSAGEFARRLKSYSDIQDNRFAFFLGAGCSISSGIPGAASLVRDRWLPLLQKYKAPDRKDSDVWSKEEFPAYDPANPAASYGSVMEKCFTTPEHRQQEIECLCDGRFPGFGYTVLGKLIARIDGTFNVVITTNFDDLVSDALYLFTDKRPLVIGHESLAGFIRPTRTRPLVVKLHGDAHLAPLNTGAETSSLRKEVEARVSGLLNDRGLIVMGYGGNDQSIAAMLAALPKDALPLGVYWVNGAQPQGILRAWLEERKAVWVEQFNFDEMMLLLRDVFDLPQPDPKLFDAVLQNYYETYKKLSESIRAAPANAEDDTLKSALERADKDLSGWLSVAIEAERLKKSDPEKAEKIYVEGLARLPSSAPLLRNYASFLKNIRKDYDKAETFYLRAIQADPNNTRSLGDYASFVKNIRKDYDKAEHLYLRAVEASPNDADTLVNYANFLKTIRKDYDQAESFYLRAIQQADPIEASIPGNYAGFLLSLGRQEAGYAALDKAIALLFGFENPGLVAELWFYAFCHWPEDRREAALKNLKSALLAGDRSPDWNLSANVERARQDGHPDLQWIELLAAVITQGADVQKLEAWPAWQKA